MGLIDMDIESITSKASKNLNVYVKAILHNKDTEIVIEDNFFMFLEIDRDYIQNRSDFIRFGFQYPTGTFMKEIYNKRDNLEVTLMYRNILYNDENKPILKKITRKYKALLIGAEGGSMDTQYTKSNPNILDKGNMSIITLQLVDRIYEVLFPLPLILTRRSSSVGNVLKTHLLETITELDIKIEDENIELITDVIEPHNDVVYDFINYQQEDKEEVLKLLELGKFLQNTKGVYNGGLGTYLQHYKDKDIMFYYPVADIRRFNETEDRLEAYIPNNELAGSTSEKSFIRDGDVLKIVVDADVKDYNIGDKTLLTKGNSVASLDLDLISSGLMFEDDGYGGIKNTKDEVYNIDTLRDLKDGNKKPIFIGATENLYTTRTNILINSLIVFSLEWKYGNPDEIFPGMPIKIIQELNYNKETNSYKPFLVEYIGSVVGTFTVINKGYGITTKINVMVNQPRKLS